MIGYYLLVLSGSAMRRLLSLYHSCLEVLLFHQRLKDDSLDMLLYCVRIRNLGLRKPKC